MTITSEFYVKLELLSKELGECAVNDTREQTLSVIDRFIDHVETAIDPYCLLLEKLKNLREAYLPTVEDVQAIYSIDTKQD